MSKTFDENRFGGCFYRGVVIFTGWAEFEQACRRGAVCEPPEEVESCLKGEWGQGTWRIIQDL